MATKPPGAGWQAVGKVGGFKRRGAGGKWEYWYPGDQPDKSGRLHHEELKDYNLEIVSQHPDRAIEIAKRLKDGIDKSADICRMNPPVCRGNLGISRSSMPQIMDVPIKDMLQGSESDRKKAEAAIEAGADPNSEKSIKDLLLDKLKARGVKVENTKVAAGQLKATQREIQAGKSYGMADAYLKDKFDPADEQIIISSDNHILDGHHRWAALLIAHPERAMQVIRVDMPMREFLRESFKMEGVFRADLQGNIVGKNEPLDLNEGAKKSLINRLSDWDDLVKAERGGKYKRRWRGPDGKWRYDYGDQPAKKKKTKASASEDDDYHYEWEEPGSPPTRVPGPEMPVVKRARQVIRDAIGDFKGMSMSRAISHATRLLRKERLPAGLVQREVDQFITERFSPAVSGDEYGFAYDGPYIYHDVGSAGQKKEDLPEHVRRAMEHAEDRGGFTAEATERKRRKKENDVFGKLKMRKSESDEDLSKAKYKRRWKGADGKWQYEYDSVEHARSLVQHHYSEADRHKALAAKAKSAAERRHYKKKEQEHVEYGAHAESYAARGGRDYAYNKSEDHMVNEGVAVDLTGDDRLEKARSMSDGDLGMLADGTLVVMRDGQLSKARQVKYKRRWKQGGKWRYEYDEPRPSEQRREDPSYGPGGRDDENHLATVLEQREKLMSMSVLDFRKDYRQYVHGTGVSQKEIGRPNSATRAAAIERIYDAIRGILARRKAAKRTDEPGYRYNDPGLDTAKKSIDPLDLIKSEMAREMREPDTFQVGAVTYHKASNALYKSEQARPSGMTRPTASEEYVTVRDADRPNVTRAGPEGRLVAPNFGLLIPPKE